MLNAVSALIYLAHAFRKPARLLSGSAMSDSALPWTVSCQAPLSMGFPTQGYWSRLPFPSPGDLPNAGIESTSLHWQVDSLPLNHLGSPEGRVVIICITYGTCLLTKFSSHVEKRIKSIKIFQQLNIFSLPQEMLSPSRYAGPLENRKWDLKKQIYEGNYFQNTVLYYNSQGSLILCLLRETPLPSLPYSFILSPPRPQKDVLRAVRLENTFRKTLRLR